MTRRLLCLALLVPVFGAGRAQEPSPPPAAEQTIEVTAERFAFQPSEIKTTAGTTLKIVLSSDDTTHAGCLVRNAVSPSGVTFVSLT